jgi:hypothetical protein
MACALQVGLDASQQGRERTGRESDLVPQAYNYKHLNATGVSTISISNYGMLHGLVLNQLSTGSTAATTGLITIYNATTTAASTDASVVAIVNPASTGVADWIYDALMSNGLTVQIGSVVAPIDFTITFT